MMGISKTEVNLRRLIAAAPQQRSKAKLEHYVSTLRELLEQLVAETPTDCPLRNSKAKINDFVEKIEAIAGRIDDPLPSLPGPVEAVFPIRVKASPRSEDVSPRSPSSPGLRRRFVSYTNAEGRTHKTTERTTTVSVTLDSQAKSRIEKQRSLQLDLTDEMIGLAKQLKENSFMINRSLQDTEKILYSTREAVEQSLAQTSHVNKQAKKMYSESSKRTCFTWLLIMAMSCIFAVFVLLIHLT